MKTVFDIGMYDGSDTTYYLEEGYGVVAVEANPALVHRAQIELGSYIASGQLQVLNAAISDTNEAVQLVVCGDDLASSSIYEEKVRDRTPIGTFTVPGITIQELFERFGIPYYLKIDIEGADAQCVSALSPGTKPHFLSLEIDRELEDTVAHIAAIGFSKFKIINQCNFREASNQSNLRDRLSHKFIRLLGYMEPHYVRRRGRWFKLFHSSGPAPWCSDGRWCSRDELLRKWKQLKSLEHRNVWFDLHAM